MTIRLFLLLAIISGIACPSFATTYYVSKSGTDSNSCATAQSSTPANGKLTIANAIANCISGGDTLVIGNGTYTESIANTLPSGSSGAPTIVRAANERLAILQPTTAAAEGVAIYCNKSFITIDGLKVDMSVADDSSGGTYAFGAYCTTAGQTTHDIIFENIEATAADGDCGGFGSPRSGCTGITVGTGGATGVAAHYNFQILNAYTHDNNGHGMYIAGAHDVLIDGMDAANNTAGMETYTSGGGEYNLTIRNSKFHDSKDVTGVTTHDYAVLIGSASTGILFYNNLIYANPTGQGLWVGYAGASAPGIYNNTIYNNAGYCITIDGSATNALVKNNICYMNSDGAISDSGTNTTCTYNLGVDGGEGSTDDCSGSVSHDPSFVNAAGGNFHLSSAMSLAVGVATPLTGIFTTDYDHVVRGSTWDDGAFEFTAGGTGFPRKTIFKTLVVR